MSRTLIVIGVTLVILGLAWPWITRMGLFRPPGDIIIERVEFPFLFSHHHAHPDPPTAQIAFFAFLFAISTTCAMAKEMEEL